MNSRLFLSMLVKVCLLAIQGGGSTMRKICKFLFLCVALFFLVPGPAYPESVMPSLSIWSLIDSPSSPPSTIMCKVCGKLAMRSTIISGRFALYEHPGCNASYRDRLPVRRNLFNEWEPSGLTGATLSFLMSLLDSGDSPVVVH